MTDIVERLRAGSWANAPWEPEYKVPPTSLHLEAAEEIERLRTELSKYQASDEMLNECCADLDRLKAERDTALRISEQHCDVVNNMVMQLAASQAREAKLREALETVKVDLIDGRLFAAVVDTKSWHHRVLNAIALPTDDTALQEAVEAALQDSPEFDLLTRIGKYLSDVDYIGDYVEGIKQAKREVLLEAAEWFNNHYSDGDPVVYRLKEMAEEL
jgi:hypothetical protein